MAAQDEDVNDRHPFEEEAEDLFTEDDCEELNDAQNEKIAEAASTGMVPNAEWEAKFKAMIGDAGVEDKNIVNNAWKNVQRAAMATCLIRRPAEGWSDERAKYYTNLLKITNEKLAENSKKKKLLEDKKILKAKERPELREYKRLEKSLLEEKKRLEDMLKKKSGGTGTGLLISPMSDKGWLVITNNHVIMNTTEAKTAEVVFDYDKEDFKKHLGTRIFKVKQLVATSLRTQSSTDKTTQRMDYSILQLEEDDGRDDYKFLKNRAIPFEETIRVQNAHTCTKPHLKYVPLVMFSHPRGLAKRLSLGRFPKNVETYPAVHIRHNLSTLSGSSGGNLLFSFVDGGEFNLNYWRSAFLHYRAGNAVAWQSIGDDLSKQWNERS